MNLSKLTHKEEIFCQSYMRSGNKTEAYRRAYSHKKMKPETITRRAQDVFNKGNVTARIKELQDVAGNIAKEKFNIDSQEILKHLNTLRKSRIDDYIKLTTVEIPIIENGKQVGTKKELRLSYKPFEELTQEQLMCIESVKETKFGIELKLHGKEWPIEKINRHIGFYEKDNDQKNKLIITDPNEREKRIAELVAKAK